MTALVLDNVRVDHAAGTPWETCGLHDVNLRLEAGERVLVVGGNGSGKSTLASVMAGLILPTQGTCTLDGIPLQEQAAQVTLVIQHTRLQLMRPTVREELEDLADHSSNIGAAASRLNLNGLLHRRIDELSGGQQRRVGLAGALVRRTPLVILDEPMAGLDQDSRHQLVVALEELPKDAIVVVVTHDLPASRPILHHGARGRLLQIDGGRVRESANR